ncbi:MAG: pyridoxamine 5'-phosphate oxidase family protein [Parcubacteria group bacterium]|nr:pyridoxamine 5'-phosphate oxidase family protein [Parcubacteria group bacterium]
MNYNKRAKAIIENVMYATVASVSAEGMPWNSPVFAAYDEHFNFYWGTYRHSQKAENIRANGNVFLVIYDSTVPPGVGEGVYIKATAKELENPEEIAFAHKLLWDRRHVYWKLEHVQGNAPIRLYKAVPEKIWMNGEGEEGGMYIDTRVEVYLKD